MLVTKNKGRETATLEDSPGSRKEEYSREFDVLGGLFFAEDPVLPALVAILHRPEDDLGDFQARVAQADCAGSVLSIA